MPRLTKSLQTRFGSDSNPGRFSEVFQMGFDEIVEVFN
jgi:hypothetical protein